MAREKVLTHKFQMMMSEDEVKQIDDWMFSRRLKSRAQAIRQLTSLGLITEQLFRAYGSLASSTVKQMNRSADLEEARSKATRDALDLQRKILDVAIMADDVNLSLPYITAVASSLAIDVLERNGEEPSKALLEEAAKFSE